MKMGRLAPLGCRVLVQQRYQESLRASPLEALYGQSCNTPISCSDLVSRVLFGLDMLAYMEEEM